MNAVPRLVDYFLVSGLDIPSGLEPDQLSGDNLHCPPLDRPFKAKVLSHYPDSVPWNPFDNNAVCMLCHPRGLNFRTQNEHRPATFHSYLITREDGSRNYGAALTFYEKVEDLQICSAMQTLQAMHMAELSNAQSQTLYSHLSSSVYKRSPKLARKLDSKVVGTVYDMRKDTLFVTKCISVISFLPFIVTFEKFLKVVYESVISIAPLEVPIESYIYNIIYEIPRPQPGVSLKFQLGSQKLTCQRPGESELPLFDYPLKQLFELLGADNVLNIYTSVLLEHQVLLYCSDLQKLMLVAESLCTLMFPFTWQHVYVPILPASLVHFLDAPVPFIMGLHYMTNDESLIDLCSKANMCFVNIDTVTVELPEYLPEFPYKQQLIQDIDVWLKNPFCSRESLNGNQRDSGFRDSFVGFDESNSVSANASKSGSMWSLPNKMEVLQQSETLAKITALAKKTGVISSLDDISESLHKTSIENISVSKRLGTVDDHAKDLMTNNMIREVFLHYFLQIFHCYDHFVIQPPPKFTMDEWLSNRDSMENFDKTAFLGDQPEAHLPFISAFIESQMFTTFIDNKLLSNWEEMESNLKLFEQRLAKYSVRDEHGDRRLKMYNRNSMAIEGETQIEKRAHTAMTVELQTHSVEGSKTKHVPGKFPTLSSQVLQEPSSNSTNPFPRLRKKDRSASDLIKREELRSKRHTKLSDINLSSMTNTNWKFVETLLKEAKAKTKRILVEKMGQEAFELGHRESIHLGVEENTLIASLCDLLERIWSHGLQNKQGKSALWWHLLSFQEQEHFKQKGVNSRPINDPALLTPDYQSKRAAKKDMKELGAPTGTGSGSEEDCPSGTQTWPVRRHRRKPSREKELPTLNPMPKGLSFDMKNIQQITDIRSDVGCARAWVRLALEKKILSTHLKELLSKQDLTRKLYKRYAFLRCEDEREQFLFHLLSLNAVDLHCFTNTFTNIKVSYRVLIFPVQKSSGATTTSNCWFSLAGQLRETSRVPIPKHTLDISLQHKNLGVLTTMRIGHDNAGISSKWMVEHVLVRNEVTGHTYRFPCGRWLGKGVDDGALERLLIAELVPPTTDTAELSEKCRTPPRCRSPSMPRKSNEPKLQISDIQEMMGDAVNNLVKHFYKPEKEIVDAQDIQALVGNAVNNIVKHFYKPAKERGSMTGLLCGEYGLVYCMEHVFQSGFKSSKLFGKRFVWDFLEKVEEYFENLVNDTEHYEIKGEVRKVIDSYCHVVSRICKASDNVGKDGRFQLFVCVGVRDHMLQRWVKIVSKTPVCLNMYDEKSFLRDANLVQYIVQLLDSLNEFPIQLEKSLIKDVKL